VLDGMRRLVVPRLLATGVVVTGSTAVRAATRCIDLWARKTPTLVRLSAGALTSEDGDHAGAVLRDELIGLLRDSAEASWLELRRGVDDFDSFTRTDEDATEHSRRYRVKP
jgi:hypothetical protein